MADRMLRGSICTSEKLSLLSDFEFRLWTHLLTQVDDHGRGDGRSAIIKGLAFPLIDSVTAGDIERGLMALAQKECIKIYYVSGKRYFYFPTWSEHQRLRETKPKYPAPEEACEGDSVGASETRVTVSAANCGELRQIAADCGRLPLARQETEEEVETEVETEEKLSLAHSGGETAAQKAAKTIDAKKKFEIFWSAYPRKTGKGKAETKFLSIKPSDELFKQMMSALKECKSSEQWTSDGGKYIPYPATWLHQRRWEDEPDTVETGTTNIFAQIQEQERRYGG